MLSAIAEGNLRYAGDKWGNFLLDLRTTEGIHREGEIDLKSKEKEEKVFLHLCCAIWWPLGTQ